VADASGAPPRRRGLARSLHRLSIRSRLALGVILVATAGLVVADVVVYQEISSYLNTQVDIELQAGASALVSPQNHIDIGRAQSTTPLGTAAEVISETGQVLNSSPASFKVALPPGLLGSLVRQINANVNADLALFDAQAHFGSSSASYRVLPESASITLPASLSVVPVIVLVAIPLGPLSGTLHRLVVIDLLATAALVVALGLLGYAAVRVGLRPLRSIEETAGEIAAGDLSRRVEADELPAEVGRLGTSLNEMLGQIEHAFSEQQASEARLRQFIADASHELRTPVTSIRGYAELFRRGAASRPEDLARSMQRIEDESVRMGGLIDDLLLLARLGSGRPLVLEPVDLAGIVADTAADAQVQEPDRVVVVDLIPSAVIRGDDPRLRQLLGNLLQNALRYSPAASAVEVALRVEGEEAVVTVTDHGTGIDPEHLPHIFDRFYRADPSRARDRGGTGLGLSIVSSIAEAHGGSVAVASAPGNGSTFTVRLPLAPIAPEDDEGVSGAPKVPEPALPAEIVAASPEGGQGISESEVGVPGPL